MRRAGYDTFGWQNRAILRAYQWLHNVAVFYAAGYDTWQFPLVDHFYGTYYGDGRTTSLGKNMGWTNWTHSDRGAVINPCE